jgi:hypothetical protein
VNDRWNETWHRLREWTNGQAPSEALAAQIMHHEGFTAIDPSHPLGGRDGKKDAVATFEGNKWIMAAYFPRGQRSLHDIKEKFVSDYDGVATNQAFGMAFVTNQELTLGEREVLTTSVSGPTKIYHLERISIILDRPDMHAVRAQFLGIDEADGIPTALTRNDSRAQTLSRWERQAEKRRRQRLQAAGVPPDRLDLVAGSMRDSIHEEIDVPPGEVRLILAPMGRGKTEIAHKWYLDALNKARSTTSAPIPLWLRARTLNTDVEAAVVGELGRPIISTAGAAIVVDGLDEIDPVQAERIMDSAEEFAAGWPKVSVLATGRPQRFLMRYQKAELPAWSSAYGRDLVRIMTGERLPSRLLSPETIDALHLPLLAITIGSRIASGNSAPASRSQLLSSIAEQSLLAARIDLTSQLVSTLTQIAAHVVETGGSSFRAGDLSPDALLEVERTPLVSNDNGQFTFVLPVLEQFYAMQALLKGQVSWENAASTTGFPRWRYALALAVDISDSLTADRIMALLAASNPAAASWILRELFSSRRTSRSSPEDLENLIALPIHSEISFTESSSAPLALAASLRLRDAELTWRSGLGKVARLLGGTLPDGGIPQWDVSLHNTNLTICEIRALRGADIEAHDFGPYFWTEDMDWGRWTSRRSVTIPGGPVARWQWAHGNLKYSLENIFRNFDLECDPSGMLAAERQWKLARIINDQYHEDPISVADLREKIAEQLARTADVVRASWSSSKGSYDRDDLLWLDERLTGSGATVERPHLAPDRTTGHWLWSRYTPTHLQALVNQILAAAIDGYRDLVERNFPNFGPALGRYSIWPIRITGVLNVPPEESLTGRIMDDPRPALSYFLVHDNESSRDGRADIQLASMVEFNEDDAFDLIKRSARIGGPFAPTALHHEALRLTDKPATEYAYS